MRQTGGAASERPPPGRGPLPPPFSWLFSGAMIPNCPPVDPMTRISLARIFSLPAFSCGWTQYPCTPHELGGFPAVVPGPTEGSQGVHGSGQASVLSFPPEGSRFLGSRGRPGIAPAPRRSGGGLLVAYDQHEGDLLDLRLPESSRRSSRSARPDARGSPRATKRSRTERAKSWTRS